MTVMIVDDSPATRRMIRRVLEMTGLPVDEFIEAGDGHQALAHWEQAPVDLVFTDINMPGMNGEEFLEELRRRNLVVPVLVISTDATQDRQERMRALGAHGYISKPFSPEALRDQVERILEVPRA